MLLPEQPLLDGEESCLPDGARAVEGGGRAGRDVGAALRVQHVVVVVHAVDVVLLGGGGGHDGRVGHAPGLVGRVVGGLGAAVVVVRHGRRQRHPVIVGDLQVGKKEKGLVRSVLFL